MCGIVGYIGNKVPKDIILKGLKQLEYRGYDSSGLAVIHSDGTQIVRAVGKVSNLESKVAQMTFKGTTAMGHTRWATHGAVTEENSHPHRAGNTTLVHNGILENFSQLREEVIEHQRALKSDTDTEIIAHLIDIESEKGIPLRECLVRVVPKLKGSYAFVVSSSKEPNLLIGVCNGIPLWIGPNGEDIYLSSDLRGLSPFTNRGFCLKKGEWAECRNGSVQISNFAGIIVTEHLSFVPINQESSGLDGYEHFMLKEILEQPLAILKTVQSLNSTLLLETLPLENWNSVVFVACGSARHSGLMGQKYFDNLAGISSSVEYASEFKDRLEILPSSTLIILISQSGETADTISALREAKAMGLSTLSITNVKQSTLARESDYSIFTEAGTEVSVASTKAFTAQVSLLMGLAVHWGIQKNILSIPTALKLQENFALLPELVAQTLKLDVEIRATARELLFSNHFFFLGKGILFPIALECALKLKEISYSFAEGYPSGELKHGPLALIDKKSTVIILAPGKSSVTSEFETENIQLQEKMMSALQEVKSRGATVWVWGAEHEFFRKEAHFFSPIPDCISLLEPILDSVLGQLFAYHFAKLKGTEIDTPRNLAKSVTVE